MSTIFVITFYGVIILLITASAFAGVAVGRWWENRKEQRNK